jgi:hypothetical protein
MGRSVVGDWPFLLWISFSDPPISIIVLPENTQSVPHPSLRWRIGRISPLFTDWTISWDSVIPIPFWGKYT